MKLRALALIIIGLVVGLPWPVGAVTRDELVCPLREDWKEGSKECPCEYGWKPTEEQLRVILDAHAGWIEKRGWTDPAIRGQAILCRANLVEANLKGALLRHANLESARLDKANLESANLRGALVTKARLAFANLGNTLYAPASPPPDGYLEGITGLATVTFPPGQHSGLVQLRDLLQKAGLRELERQATFAIERNKALHAREGDSLINRLGGWLQLIFFEWTTGWGLYPGRALAIMFALIGLTAVVYTVPIASSPAHASDRHAIIRVWPADRATKTPKGFAPAGTERMERLTADVPAVFA